MKSWKLALALATPLLLAACGTSQDNRALRAALDKSEVSLRESVAIAEASEGGTALKATVLVRSSVLSVGAKKAQAVTDVRIDPASGAVLSAKPAAIQLESCDGSVSLADAIAAAERAVDGEAVVAAPDDDGECNREIKVLDGDDVLWEVKVAPDGSIVEQEEADDGAETEA